MAYEEKKMFEGNWKCSGCGASITKLPFEPDPARVGALKCLECHKASQPVRKDKQMFSGNWKCAGCGGEITSLPFQPHPDKADNLKCFDCFKAGK